MGLIIKIHRADNSLERVIVKEGCVDVIFHKGAGHKPFMRFNKDEKSDVDFEGRVELYSDTGTHLGTTHSDHVKGAGR
jgi:hypothetical protein